MRFVILVVAAGPCDNSLSGIILMDPPLETGDTGNTGHTGLVETDTDTDSDSDTDSDADTDTSTTGETGIDTPTGDTAHTGIVHTGTPVETGLYMDQLCVTVGPPVAGPVDIYVFETNLNDDRYWVDPFATPVVGTPFATGEASRPICGDMTRVPYVPGHTMLVLAVWNNGISELSAVNGNAQVGYVSYVLEIALSGSPLACYSDSHVLAAPYAYTGCTL